MNRSILHKAVVAEAVNCHQYNLIHSLEMAFKSDYGLCL